MPEISLIYAGILALLMAALSIRVPMRRAALDQPWGTGDDLILETRVRVFGNFTEYVPMILLLMWMLELRGQSAIFLHSAGTALVVTRLIHALILTAGPMSAVQKIGRAIGAMGTWLVLVACGVRLLIIAFP